MKLNGWQRLWVTVSALFLLVAAFGCIVAVMSYQDTYRLGVDFDKNNRLYETTVVILMDRIKQDEKTKHDKKKPNKLVGRLFDLFDYKAKKGKYWWNTDYMIRYLNQNITDAPSPKPATADEWLSFLRSQKDTQALDYSKADRAYNDAIRKRKRDFWSNSNNTVLIAFLSWIAVIGFLYALGWSFAWVRRGFKGGGS
jgi:hypothetical protein